MLYACSVPMANFIARALDEHAGDDKSPLSVWFSLLDAPGDYLQPQLASTKTAPLRWHGRGCQKSVGHFWSF